MIGYGMWIGGMIRCSGKTKSGDRCKRNLYATDISRGEYCAQHKEQDESWQRYLQGRKSYIETERDN